MLRQLHKSKIKLIEFVFFFFFFGFFVPQVNDFVRDKFTEKDDTIPLFAEIMAGGCVSTECQTFSLFLFLMNECVNESKSTQ